MRLGCEPEPRCGYDAHPAPAVSALRTPQPPAPASSANTLWGQSPSQPRKGTWCSCALTVSALSHGT